MFESTNQMYIYIYVDTTCIHQEWYCPWLILDWVSQPNEFLKGGNKAVELDKNQGLFRKMKMNTEKTAEEKHQHMRVPGKFTYHKQGTGWSKEVGKQYFRVTDK